MKALVFQHVSHESPGLLGKLMDKRGFDIVTVNFGDGESAPANADDFSVLAIMGGPMNVYQNDRYPYLAREIRFVREFIKSGRPVIGICLGAQIMAAALGAKVRAGGSKEIGWYDVSAAPSAASDPVFSLFSQSEKVFQWHGDGFETPAGAVNLAFSDDFPNQAFRYGDRAYALQFHLETDEKIVRQWLERNDNRLEIENSGLDIEEIERGAEIYPDGINKLAESVFGAFLKLV